ncbi:MAG: hypothetical protein JWN83_1673 [Chitinophagaceae bacterium]|nr:hypothetical protein [Chitinophagaceae bacterium]
MKLIKTLLFSIFISTAMLSCSKTTTTTDVTGNWIRKSDFDGVVRSEAVSFVINDKAYIATGYDGTSRLNDLWQYDAANNFWVQKADFPGTARNSAIAFTAAGKGYVGTGYDGVNKLKDFWQYNPTTNSWLRKNDFGGTARYDAVAFSILDAGYVATGFDGNYLKDFWQYNPTSDTWTQQVGFGGSKRMAAVAFTFNNKGYICTGTNNGSPVNDFWEYDPLTSAWTEKRKISNVSDDTYDDAYTIVRSNAVAFIIDNKAYVTTGENGSLLNTTWEYDFASDVWTNKTIFQGSVRTGAVAFGLTTGGYVTTGRSSTLNFDDLRQFLPTQAENDNDD